ncbi:MAG TPA: thiamine pyrophosphate-dependent enzyme [Bryobacteraceae bacterium]|nr:thiamine pyrophosphate-dependent enzyme [Bryobacteraceae bacterium]
MSRTVAELLVDRLIDWNVDTIFGLPGDGINGIFEALRTHQKQIRFIQVRHEESAALAACGYAKYTGRRGVCLATSGPGGIHLLNGLYDAKSDGAPLLAITGHTFHDLIGTQYQQDVDLDKLFIDVAAYNQRVMGPAHVVNVVDEAIKTALSRHAVAHITIPKDIQDWKMSDEKRSRANIPQHSADIHTRSYLLPLEADLKAAAAIINAGSRVAILAGRGCLGARGEVLELAQKVAGPIIKPLLGKGVIADRHPYTTGGVGLLGTAPSQDALAECDTLIIAGSGFPYMEFYPKPGKAKCVQIDVDPARIGLRHPADVGLAGDCASVLRALLPLLDKKKNQSFLEKAQKRMRDWNELMDERGTRMDMPMKPQVVVHELNKLLDDDAIIAGDSGTVTAWAARHIDMRGDMQFCLSGTLASMANGLPYSIAAALAFPKRQVICIIGDGGMSMLMAEIATLVKYGLNVKVLVINNQVLGMIKWEQIAQEGNPQFGVELQPIDFAGVARCCGATGFTIDNPRDAAGILREAMAHTGPVIVDALVDPHEPLMPGHVSTEQALKFGQALARGQKDAAKILQRALENTFREVV